MGVPQKPMPVRIALTPIDQTAPFQCDNLGRFPEDEEGQQKKPSGAEKARCKGLRATMAVIYRKYQNDALRSFRLENVDLKTSNTKLGGDQRTWSANNHVCPSKRKSQSSKWSAKLDCGGNLVLKNTFGNVNWQSDTAGECAGQTYIAIIKSNLQIVCLAETNKVLWSALPNTDACGITNHDKTKLRIEDDGNLVLFNGDNFKSGIKIWQSGTGSDQSTLPKKRSAFKKSHGYIMCKAKQD